MRKIKVKGKYIFIIGSVLILLILFLFLTKDKPVGIDVIDKNVYDITVDKDAVNNKEDKDKELVIEELNKKVADGMMNISMNTTPVFKNGSSDGDLLIVNEEINKYPQIVEIYRDDTKELIYRSGGIPVGSRIDSSKLDVNLPKGDYNCTAYFLAINDMTNDLIGKAGAKIVIKILN